MPLIGESNFDNDLDLPSHEDFFRKLSHEQHQASFNDSFEDNQV